MRRDELDYEPLFPFPPAPGGTYDQPVLWFSSTFLNKPPPGWEVDWDAIDHTTPQPVKLGETIYDLDTYEKPTGYMAGILVKHIEEQRVWRLTGDGFGGSQGDRMLEGRWPD